jgi:(2Fe-2S) ferredoxin
MINKPFYRKHVFFCTNQRESGKKCCNDANASHFRDYAKQKIKELKLHGISEIRINTAGCLGRCSEGPCIVIYPDNVWYTYQSESDINDIIEKHLIAGEIVERLLI